MSIAFVTMVYNDQFFLEIWLRHYRKHVAPEHLYIITHGPQPYAHEMAGDCNVIEIERDPLNPRLDQDRFVWLSDFCSELTSRYQRVIWNDVDEILVLDPDHPATLADYILDIPREQEVVTALGLELCHRFDHENDYDYSRPMFAQRRYVRMNGWYTKPSLTSVPITWGPDGHGSSHHRIHLDPNLYTFHLKWFDQMFHINRHQERLKLRFKGDDGQEIIVGAGSWAWSEQTYLIVSNAFLRQRIIDGARAFDFSRHRQRVIDSFKEGRTGMYKIDWFVDGDLHLLPERFIGIV